MKPKTSFILDEFHIAMEFPKRTPPIVTIYPITNTLTYGDPRIYTFLIIQYNISLSLYEQYALFSNMIMAITLRCSILG